MAASARNPLLDGKPPHPLLVVLSGPSGVGKDSALMRMRELGFPFHFVVTATSRAIRAGEIDGYDYHFVTPHRFGEMIAQKELLEWAEVYGHYKGIPKAEVRSAFDSGRDVILRIDVQGVRKIKSIAPEAVFIFMVPGSNEELHRRLMLRRSESAEEIERRLSLAQQEIDQVDLFDYVVVNSENHLDEAVGQIRSIIAAEKQRVRPRYVQL